MGQEFTAAKTHEVFSGTFECRFCGFEAPATVSASGRGSAPGHGHDSAASALHDAEMDAGGVASRTLTFVPCPKCNKVDPSSRSYRVQVIVGSLLLGAAIAGVLYFFFTRSRNEWESRKDYDIIAMVCGAVVSVIVYWWFGRAWFGAGKRVRIDMANGKIVPRDDE